MSVLFIQFSTNVYSKRDIRFYLRSWNIGETRSIQLSNMSAIVTMEYFSDTVKGDYVYNQVVRNGKSILLYLDSFSNEHWILSKYELQ